MDEHLAIEVLIRVEEIFVKHLVAKVHPPAAQHSLAGTLSR